LTSLFETGALDLKVLVAPVKDKFLKLRDVPDRLASVAFVQNMRAILIPGRLTWKRRVRWLLHRPPAVPIETNLRPKKRFGVLKDICGLSSATPMMM
jgi:hypothetical protein